FERALTLMDEEQLIPLGITVEVAHWLSWTHNRDDAVVVIHQLLTSFDGVTTCGRVGGLEMVMPMLLLRPLIAADAAVAGDFAHPRRRMLMIEQRRDPAEPLF